MDTVNEMKVCAEAQAAPLVSCKNTTLELIDRIIKVSANVAEVSDRLFGANEDASKPAEAEDWPSRYGEVGELKGALERLTGEVGVLETDVQRFIAKTQ